MVRGGICRQLDRFEGMEGGRRKTEDGRRKGITCERDQMEMNHVEGEVGK
jgi:hypothetical protein